MFKTSILIFRVGVRLGEWDTETKIDCFDEYCSDPPLDLKVDQIIIHPKYDKRLHNGDISLIRLDKTVNYTGIYNISIYYTGTVSITEKKIYNKNIND